MAILSIKSRKRFGDLVLVTLLCSGSLLLQMCILNHFAVHGVICNLPITVTIVFGLVYGSPLPHITPGELRIRSAQQIFLKQILAGSPIGLLVGLFFACLLQAIVPIFYYALPLAGWCAGYFSLRRLGPGNLLCVPLVLILTLLSEAITGWQLSLTGRPAVFNHLSEIALLEGFLNGIVAPFIYFPLRSWYDLAGGEGNTLTA